MKKNIAMRVAAFLFILTMISTCAFATTFAKYTTDGSVNETARVAKWGVTITADSKDKVEYDTIDGLSDAHIKTTEDVKVIAPGSFVKFAAVHVGGTPEVAVSVTFEAKLELKGWKIGGAEYCPLIFVVGTEEYYIGKTGITNEAELITAVQGAIAGYSQESVDANTELEDSLSVKCYWQIEKDKVVAQDDLKDTALGNLTGADVPTISLEVTCTVTQID